MSKNTYAAKLRAQGIVAANLQKQAIVRMCITTVFQASAIALNEEFGFGADRVKRFRDAMEAVMMEYGALQDGVDTEYAQSKLEQRYLQIVGEENAENT